MRVGLLSDSHGNAEATARAASLLLDAGAELLIHLGDIVTTKALEALAGGSERARHLECPVHIIFGNLDLERAALERRAKVLGIRVDDPVGRLEAAGKVIVYQHGDDPRAMERALADGVDYLCHGHTHRRRDERRGRTRIINPGALWRAAEYTVALLDVPADRLEFHRVPKRL